MNGLFQQLWRERDCFPIGGRDWFRAWGKRILTSPKLFGQIRIQSRLKRGGSKLGASIFISSDEEIQGRLEKLSIGAHTFVGRVQIAVHDMVAIGTRVCINDGAMLLSASHDVRSEDWAQKTGPIVVKDYAWIATRAIILPGVEIGRGAVVGAGAVVSKNVPDYAVASGNPAVIRENVRARNLEYDPIANLACFTAWKRLANREVNQRTEVS